MAVSFSWLAAREHTRDDRTATAQGIKRTGLRLRRRPAAVISGRPAAAVRFAHPDETGTLRDLAELDDAAELMGEILVATIDGAVVAAVSLQDGRVVANPFVLTADAVELLRVSAAALTN